MYTTLSTEFFSNDTVSVAKRLLGCYLISETKEGRTIGKILETEAYLQNDPANHAFKGQSKRNAIMFGEAGFSYIYKIYGLYHCFNVVTNQKGVGEAVLLRALEPVEGIELMKKRRGIDEVKKLANGPARLTIAMGIPFSANGYNLSKPPIYLAAGEQISAGDIITTKRIGIPTHKSPESLLRFYIK